MWNIRVLCVGKLKETFYAQAVQEYQKRLGSFCKLEIKEFAEERLPDNPTATQIQLALEKEAQRLLPDLGKGVVIALCIEGKLFSSEALAHQMEVLALHGQSRLTFVIGGSYGLAPIVKQQAQLKLSMSLMTFPHHMARVMLLEQLYRGFQILKGTKYHK
ncbi:MAG: 23S rRNA (pseudouridine(1915)-N(3))-methyltransferase RlmH [Oscillospiraceae bacterium]|nr:23S rRNA (pseudouridine(1915)-N(3))-methyltransferase RlmH [Oscillospiraceae bacterium]